MECLPPSLPSPGSCEVVLDGGKAAAEAFDPKQRYIFGFIHHGLYPLGEGDSWVPFMQLPGSQMSAPQAQHSLVVWASIPPSFLPLPPHPHPPGAGYLPLLASFKRLLPVRPVTLTASVCVAVPLLRDIVLWLGIRIVSR